MTKRSYLISTLFLFSMLSFVVMSSCGPEPEDTPDPVEEETFDGFATDQITHTHVYGTDPCPQPVVQPLKVLCYKGAEFTGCDADSVSVEGHSDGLNIKFINGKKFVRLATSEASTDASLEFTCGIDKSFTKTYTLSFFKNGNLVGTETVDVVVTVQGN